MRKVAKQDHPVVCNNGAIADDIVEVLLHYIELAVVGQEDHCGLVGSNLLINHLLKKCMDILRGG